MSTILILHLVLSDLLPFLTLKKSFFDNLRENKEDSMKYTKNLSKH